MASTIFVFTRALAKEEHLDSLTAAIEEVLGPTRREGGCISIGAFRSTRDSRLFYIYSCWDDEAAFDAHLQLPHTLRFLEVMKPLLDQPLNVTRTQSISD